jgi:hypothetical protein
MRTERELVNISQEDLATIGTGHIAYLRQTTGREISEAFPNAVNIAPDTKVWALFAADGTPLALADNEGAALANAFDNDLVAVAVH